MKISNPVFSYNSPQQNSRNNVSFKQSLRPQNSRFIKFLVNDYNPIVTQLRTLLGKLSLLKNKREILKNYNKLIDIDINSHEFMQYIMDWGKQNAKGKAVEINIEDGILKDIGKSDESCIFIINHNIPHSDSKLLSFFNSLLTREYILNNKSKTCPRPKIIVSENFLQFLDPKTRALREKFGYVGIDAHLFDTDKGKNARALFPTIKSFINDKVNIFIFPEGKRCLFEELPFENKFQTGVAEIVNKLINHKKRVKVVPLGFASSGDLGGIHVGAPIYFKRVNEKTYATAGNNLSQFVSPDYRNFFIADKLDEEGYKLITNQGQQVSEKEAPDYISGLLCENLRVSKEEAKLSLINNPKDDNIIKL